MSKTNYLILKENKSRKGGNIKERRKTDVKWIIGTETE